MIQIYKPDNTNFDKNGDMTLMPSKAIVHTILNGTWTAELSHPIDAYREYGVDTKGQYLKILEFKRFVKHFSFKKISETYSQKELLEEITVVVALDVVERDTRNPSFINESKSSDR